jgi:hypothetical protein
LTQANEKLIKDYMQKAWNAIETLLDNIFLIPFSLGGQSECIRGRNREIEWRRIKA